MKRLQRWMRPKVFVLAVALAATAGRAAEPPSDPDRQSANMKVATATIEMLAKPSMQGNAVLRVRFADKRSGGSVPISGGMGPTLLRDDGVSPDAKAGDGQHAAVVQFNGEAYAAELKRRTGWAQQKMQLPVFEVRELRSWTPFELPRGITLVPGVENLLDRFTGIPAAVNPARELLVRHPLVVDDPTRTYNACNGVGTPLGPWTFGRLMTDIANEPVTGIDPAAFVEHWLSQWRGARTINGFTVPARAAAMQAWLNKWPRLPDGRLDLAQAPMRLLAIVNRLDLGNSALYGASNGGEARLVFGALDCAPDLFSTEAMQMTVIFEYRVAAPTCHAVRAKARQWHDLGSLALGSAAYNTALQAITDQFTPAGSDPAQLPNRSAIGQVRTNDFALGSPWELRESRLIATGKRAGWLQHATVAQTPDPSVETATPARLADFINANEPAIMALTHQVPLQYPVGSPFLGGNALSGGVSGPGHFWNAPGILNLEARHRFSFATCDGCHRPETRNDFTHIRPRSFGAESHLSDFLTGANMPKTDPVSGVSRTFHELLDRAAKLDVAAHMSCTRLTDFALEELFVSRLPAAFRH